MPQCRHRRRSSNGHVNLTQIEPFFNYGNTISGAGQIGGGGLTLVNLGTIDANSAKYALTIGTPEEAVYNSGLMEATGGGANSSLILRLHLRGAPGLPACLSLAA